MTERDHHESCFYDFADTYGDELATDMLQVACECHYSRAKHLTSGNITARMWDSENSSGDQLNYYLKGEVNDTRHFVEFEIEDGNFNGTVVHVWERVWKNEAHPLPKTSLWMFQPARAIATKFIATGQAHLLKSMHDQMNGPVIAPMPKDDADLMRRPDPDYLKTITQKFLIPMGDRDAEIPSRITY